MNDEQIGRLVIRYSEAKRTAALLRYDLMQSGKQLDLLAEALVGDPANALDMITEMPQAKQLLEDVKEFREAQAKTAELIETLASCGIQLK